jgi:hypothetical protein
MNLHHPSWKFPADAGLADDPELSFLGSLEETEVVKGYKVPLWCAAPGIEETLATTWVLERNLRKHVALYFKIPRNHVATAWEKARSNATTLGAFLKLADARPVDVCNFAKHYGPLYGEPLVIAPELCGVVPNNLKNAGGKYLVGVEWIDLWRAFARVLSGLLQTAQALRSHKEVTEQSWHDLETAAIVNGRHLNHPVSAEDLLLEESVGLLREYRKDPDPYVQSACAQIDRLLEKASHRPRNSAERVDELVKRMQLETLAANEEFQTKLAALRGHLRAGYQSRPDPWNRLAGITEAALGGNPFNRKVKFSFTAGQLNVDRVWCLADYLTEETLTAITGSRLNFCTNCRDPFMQPRHAGPQRHYCNRCHGAAGRIRAARWYQENRETRLARLREKREAEIE